MPLDVDNGLRSTLLAKQVFNRGRFRFRKLEGDTGQNHIERARFQIGRLLVTGPHGDGRILLEDVALILFFALEDDALLWMGFE